MDGTVSCLPPDRPTKPFRYRILLPTVIVLLGVLFALPPHILSSTQVIGPDFNMLDGSWEVDLPMRPLKGTSVTENYVFTYGPLFQLAHTPWLVGTPGDLASTIRFHALWPTCFIALGLWYILAQTTAPLWNRSVAYLLCLYCWPPAQYGCKAYLGMIVLTACGFHAHFTSDLITRPQRVAAALLWTMSAPLLMLYSFELGIVALLGQLLLLATFTLWTWSMWHSQSVAWHRVLQHTAMVIGGSLVFCTVVSQKWFWPSYLHDSWETVRGYSSTMAVAFLTKTLLFTVAALIGGFAFWTFAGSEVRRSWGEAKAPDREYSAIGLMAAACFSLLWLRFSMTRSDMPHLRLAYMPLLFFGGLLLPCYLRAHQRKLTALVYLCWAFAPFVYPIPLNLALAELPSAIRPGFLETHLELSDPVVRDAASNLKSLDHDSVLVWPYQNVIALAAGKRIPAYTLQSYSAGTPRLEQASINHMRSVPDLPIIYVENGWPIDGVENLSRTSLIFRYLLENYTAQEPCHSQFLTLKHTPSRAREWQKRQLPGTPQSFRPGNESVVFEFSEATPEDCRASDLLLMRVRAAKTPFWGIWKPGLTYVTFELSNGEKRKQKLVLPPDGETHEILISACTVRDRLFKSVFHPDRQWRATERLVRLSLEWQKGDALSRTPPSITLEDVSVLRCLNRSVIEASLADQERKELWDECFTFQSSPPVQRTSQPVPGVRESPVGQAEDASSIVR